MESYDAYMAKLAIAMIKALYLDNSKSIKQPIQKIKIATYGVC